MLDFFLDGAHTKDNIHSGADKTNNETGRLAHLFNVINANLSSELVDKTGAIYQFNVKGNFFSFTEEKKRL